MRSDRRAIAAALLVCFMYGALLWGLVPIRPRMSWETHLAAALIGAAFAVALKHLDAAAPVRYSWEEEGEAAAAEASEAASAADPSEAHDDERRELRPRA
jgi:hypothetical protein